MDGAITAYSNKQHECYIGKQSWTPIKKFIQRLNLVHRHFIALISSYYNPIPNVTTKTGSTPRKASQAVSRMSVPTVVLGLTVEEQPDNANIMPKAQTVNFELSREALATMLGGLKQIAEQLGKLSGDGSTKAGD